MIGKTITGKAGLVLAAAGIAILFGLAIHATASGGMNSYAESPLVPYGVACLCASLVLYLAGGFARSGIRFALTFNMALHLGMLVVIGAMQANAVTGSKGLVYIREGSGASSYVTDDSKEHPLGFEIVLDRFTATTYPESTRAESFSSDITIRDGGKTTGLAVAVNRSAGYGGYAIHQHSYGAQVTDISRVRIETGPQGAVFEVPFGRVFEVEDCGRALVGDFLPSTVTRDGKLMVRKSEIIDNPAYVIHKIDPYGEQSSDVVHADKTTMLGSCGITVRGHSSVAYTVLSVVRAPFDNLILFGAVLTCIGACGLLTGRRKNAVG